MSKTIVLEPFKNWAISYPEGANGKSFLVRQSDRHTVRVDLRDSVIYLFLDVDGNQLRTLQTFCKDELAHAIGYADSYIDRTFLPAKDAANQLDHLTSEVKRLEDLLPKDNEGPTPCPES